MANSIKTWLRNKWECFNNRHSMIFKITKFSDDPLDYNIRVYTVNKCKYCSYVKGYTYGIIPKKYVTLFHFNA